MSAAPIAATAPVTIAMVDVVGRLNRAVRAAGGETAFARQHGLSRQEVHEARKGNRHPGPGVLGAVGVRKVVSVRYELIGAPAAAELPQEVTS